MRRARRSGDRYPVKPAPFAYHRPDSVTEAVSMLRDLGSDAKVLAGGQSLLPMMSMRLASPLALVDINRLQALDYVRADPDGVRVGALARHSTVESDPASVAVQPLLRQALRLVAHPTIRNRGTTVGSLAHADPSGEMTAVLALLDGSVRIARADGDRVVEARDFFVGPLESAVGPGELAVEAFFPALATRAGTSFVEVARRHGDYAVCGVGALVELDDELRVSAARIAFISVSPTPLVLDVTPALRGAPAGEVDRDAVAALARGGVEPEGDIHATAAYRRHLAGVLAARATVDAAAVAARRCTMSRAA